MFYSSKSSAQCSSTTQTFPITTPTFPITTPPAIPITSNAPITPISPIPIRSRMSAVLGASLSFYVIQSGGICRYFCTTCDKVFPTTQALGGHQNAHRKERNVLFAHEQQRASEENDKDPDNGAVYSPDPFSWSPLDFYKDYKNDGPADDTTFNNNKTRKMCAYDFFHFMGMAGDSNPKWVGVGFGSSGGRGGASGSGTKKRSKDDHGDDDEAYHKKKKAKGCDVDYDLKFVMPDVNLSLARGSDGGFGGGLEGSESSDDSYLEDGECMFCDECGDKTSTSKAEELDLTLKL